MSEKNPAVVPAIITNTNVAIPTNAPDIQKFITVRSAQVEMAKKVLKDSNAKLEVWYRELLNAAQEMSVKLLRVEVKLVKTVNADVAAETGINNTGTFHLICANCDSREFADYENPENYNDKPTQIMLSQIAQKSYLKEIYKQTKNIELHNLVRQIYNTKIGNLQELAALDRSDYIKQYLYAKNT